MFILWGISEIGCLASNYKITKLKSTIYCYRFRYVYREIYKHIYYRDFCLFRHNMRNFKSKLNVPICLCIKRHHLIIICKWKYFCYHHHAIESRAFRQSILKLTSLHSLHGFVVRQVYEYIIIFSLHFNQEPVYCTNIVDMSDTEKALYLRERYGGVKRFLRRQASFTYIFRIW